MTSDGQVARGAMGRLMGTLAGRSIPEHEAKRCEEHSKAGGALLCVHCHAGEQVVRSKARLSETGQDIASAAEASSAPPVAEKPAARSKEVSIKLARGAILIALGLIGIAHGGLTYTTMVTLWVPCRHGIGQVGCERGNAERLGHSSAQLTRHDPGHLCPRADESSAHAMGYLFASAYRKARSPLEIVPLATDVLSASSPSKKAPC